MSAATAIRRGFTAQRPDPERLWIRYTPKGWPAPPHLVTDLSAPRPASRVSSGAHRALPQPDNLEALDDLLWLPPVAAAARDARATWIGAAVDAGIPVLAQVEPGEEIAPADGLTPAVDLFETLAGGDPSAMAEIGPGGVVLWPLVAGWTDRAEVVEPGLAALREGGVERVVGVRSERTPRELRELAERVAPTRYERLFHAPPANRRDFARAVTAAGMNAAFDRPLPSAPPILRRNRRLAGHLFRVGELWLGLERSELVAQAFFRAARWVDESSYDVEALVEEGNLGIVDWIEDPVQRAVEEYCSGEPSEFFFELQRAYLAPVAGRASANEVE